MKPKTVAMKRPRRLSWGKGRDDPTPKLTEEEWILNEASLRGANPLPHEVEALRLRPAAWSASDDEAIEDRLKQVEVKL